MEITVSPLRSEDAVVIGPEHHRVWRAAYTGLLPASVLESLDDAGGIEKWAARGRHHERHGCSAEGAVTLVARSSDGRPVGWVGTGPPRDVPPPAPSELWSLYVVPEAWGRGVAETLLVTALGDAPAYLWVLGGNDRAVAFYRKHGFVLDGVVRPVSVPSGRDGAQEARMVRAAHGTQGPPGT